MYIKLTLSVQTGQSFIEYVWMALHRNADYIKMERFRPKFVVSSFAAVHCTPFKSHFTH
jgi:hypothetical protein